MKTTGFSILLIWFAIFANAANTFAQDSPQSHLPEGATARLGKGSITEIAYSPDGTRLAVASSIGIWLYDAQTDEALDLLTGHTGEVSSVSFSPDGNTLASGSRDMSVGRPPAVRCAPSQGIRFRSTACRFHPMATRSPVVEFSTTPCVCGMRPPAVRCAPS